MRTKNILKGICHTLECRDPLLIHPNIFDDFIFEYHLRYLIQNHPNFYYFFIKKHLFHVYLLLKIQAFKHKVLYLCQEKIIIMQK